MTGTHPSTPRPLTADRQLILGAHFPGVNNTTVWSDPESGSQIAPESFLRFAEIAERGRLDFIFLAEGLRLREQRGLLHDLDVVGRPATLPILAALAAATEHIGLIGTLSTTYNEPYELARQLAGLDALSGGRAGWNVVTSPDAFTGENFRRGGYLPRERRYQHAGEFLATAQQIWDAASGRPPRVDVDGEDFSVHGTVDAPAPVHGRPVILQAGDSDEGRDLAAREADAVFTRHGGWEAGQAFTADIRRRAAAAGRPDGAVRVLPGVTVVVGDTDEEAAAEAEQIRRAQVSGATALLTLERIWNRDLSGWDPDGPLPDVEPVLEDTGLSQGRVRHVADPHAEVARLREISQRHGLTLRETVIATGQRQDFVGSPETVAQELIRHVEHDVCDGFILIPHLTPGGLEPFVDRVVPLLQERGALRTDYPEDGGGLRGLLGAAAHPTAGRAS